MKFRIFTNEDNGISGIVPEGWKEKSAGEFYRDIFSTDGTVLVQLGVAGLTGEQLLSLLTPKIGLEEFPNSIGGFITNYFSWDLYNAEVQDPKLGSMMVDIALTHTDAGAYIVLLQALPDEYKDLHYSVFLRAVDSLAPVSTNNLEKGRKERQMGIIDKEAEVLLVKGEMLENEASDVVGDILRSELSLSTAFVHLEELDKIDYSGITLIFFPGGDCSRVRLSKKALGKIQKAVASGMGYIGSCCGAFLAVEATTMSNHWNIGGDSFGIFPGLTEATAGNGVWPFYIDVGHPILAKSSFTDSISPVMSMKFVGGMTNIVPSYEKDLQNWKIATLDKPAYGKALGKRVVIAATVFGKGRVFLSGPHPEASEDTHALILAAAEWMSNRLDPMSDQHPFVDADIPLKGFVGYPFRTSAKNSHDPLGFPLGFTWNFGDSSPKQYRPEALHIYELPGRYTVTLIVTTGSRQSIQSKEVVISED